ncbi:MAG: hypothetical protein AAF702_51330 [Chloroflexota bacterium]
MLPNIILYVARKSAELSTSNMARLSNFLFLFRLHFAIDSTIPTVNEQHESTQTIGTPSTTSPCPLFDPIPSCTMPVPTAQEATSTTPAAEMNSPSTFGNDTFTEILQGCVESYVPAVNYFSDKVKAQYTA